MTEVFNCPNCASFTQPPPALFNSATHIRIESRIACKGCDSSWDVELFHERFVGPDTVNPPEPDKRSLYNLEEQMARGPQPKTMKVPCSFPKCECFKTIDPTECQDMPVHWFCKVHEGTQYMRCAYIPCEKITIMGEDSGQAGPPQWYCEPHKIAKMIDESRCAFMSCSLQGRFTDPSLGDKKYCEHHRRVMVDSNEAQAHHDAIKKLQTDRDSWRRTAERLEREKTFDRKQVADLETSLGKTIRLGMKLVTTSEGLGYISMREGKEEFETALRDLREHLCKK